MGADENNRFVLDGKSGTPSFRPHPSFILIRNPSWWKQCVCLREDRIKRMEILEIWTEWNNLLVREGRIFLELLESTRVVSGGVALIFDSFYLHVFLSRVYSTPVILNLLEHAKLEEKRGTIGTIID